MGRLRRWAAGFATGAAAVAYARWVLERNDALVRPPVRDADGTPLPVRTFRYADGEEVGLIDVGPTAPGAGDPAPPLVWIPGADGPKETFRYQLARFARRHRVIAADLRSRFGDEDGFDRFADDLRELLDRLGATPAVLVGQSLGTAIALRFALRWPGDVRGLVLANPLARISYEHVGFDRSLLIPLAIAATRYLPTEASRALAVGVWAPLGVWIFDDSPGRDRLIEYALHTGARTERARVSRRRVARLKGWDLRPELPELDVPTLVLKGPRDVYTPPAWAREIARLLPDARYVEIPGTGHCSHISRPGAFNRVLEAWLRRLAGAEGEDPAAGEGSPVAPSAEGGQA